MGCLATTAGGFLVVLMVVGVVGGQQIKPSCKFTAMYNFGDSNSDTGGISAAFQPISWPYGQTFFNKPAGRDSDGRLLIDFIGIFFLFLLRLFIYNMLYVLLLLCSCVTSIWVGSSTLAWTWMGYLDTSFWVTV